MDESLMLVQKNYTNRPESGDGIFAFVNLCSNESIFRAKYCVSRVHISMSKF